MMVDTRQPQNTTERVNAAQLTFLGNVDQT
jgi:hypothetical protein